MAVAAATGHDLHDAEVVGHADPSLTEAGAAQPEDAGHPNAPAVTAARTPSHHVLVLGVITLAQLAWLATLAYGLLRILT